jgi:hypothetical protein
VVQGKRGPERTIKVTPKLIFVFVKNLLVDITSLVQEKMVPLEESELMQMITNHKLIPPLQKDIFAQCLNQEIPWLEMVQSVLKRVKQSKTLDFEDWV